MRLALIGRDVAASQSPKIHEFLFSCFHEKCKYDLISLPKEKFSKEVIDELFLRYDGLNVTMPYKREILPYLSKLTGAAEKTKAVNTVLCKKREGFNFDCDGLELLLKENGIEGKSALVLGAGGAGRCAAYVLSKAGMKVSVYGKYEEQLISLQEDFEKVTPLDRLEGGTYDLVLNCTGIGMGSTVGALPRVKTNGGEIPFSKELFSAFGVKQAVDLIYVPKETAFLSEAKRAGAKTVNGEGMLFYQAYFADCCFLLRAACEEEAESLHKKYREELK